MDHGPGHGMPMASPWPWNGHGMVMTWTWHSHGMAMAWPWHGHGLGPGPRLGLQVGLGMRKGADLHDILLFMKNNVFDQFWAFNYMFESILIKNIFKFLIFSICLDLLSKNSSFIKEICVSNSFSISFSTSKTKENTHKDDFFNQLPPLWYTDRHVQSIWSSGLLVFLSLELSLSLPLSSLTHSFVLPLSVAFSLYSCLSLSLSLPLSLWRGTQRGRERGREENQKTRRPNQEGVSDMQIDMLRAFGV